MSKMLRQFMKRLFNFVLKFWVLFILVEVIWMLLPFAGFLYGSVFQMNYLNRNPNTAWLTHFVFPVHTLFPSGIILMSLGFIVFLVGAGQIYAAKFRKTGLVKTGLYGKIRHPQYIALVLFGVGTLMTWGRFVTFIAFFVMMFLYYRLARVEEKNCERLFGKAYEEYQTRTYFLFPGEQWIVRPWERIPRPKWPAWIARPIHFVLIVGLAVALGNLIQAVKVRYQDVLFITAEMESLRQVRVDNLIPYRQSQDGRIILVQGPLGLAQRPDYADRLIAMITNSSILRERLDFLRNPGEERAVVLVERPGGPPETAPDEDSKVELFIVRTQPLEPGMATEDILNSPGKTRLVSAVVAALDPARSQGQDPVVACWDHPEMGILPRWGKMMDRIKERTRALGGDAGKGPRKLILVQAPLVRARDKAFAQQIMDRLVRSETVQEMLARYQIGGDLLAVAFPRPGPNWYREHHGVPQIGAFIMLVRKKRPLTDLELFRPDMKSARVLEAAFIVEMDFAIPYPNDPVYEPPFVVGPLPDLEERWDFFLSGLR